MRGLYGSLVAGLGIRFAIMVTLLGVKYINHDFQLDVIRVWKELLVIDGLLVDGKQDAVFVALWASFIKKPEFGFIWCEYGHE